MTVLSPGDRVIYVGDRFTQYHGLPLAVHQVERCYVCCRFEEPDRPGGFGLTTWIDPDDLIAEEV